MATPKVPIVKGQYPIPYKDLILTDQKKKFRSHPLGQSSSSSSNSIIKHITEKSNPKENEEYGDDEYVVEKILSHKNRPDGRYQYYLKWKDYPDSENSWEDEENIYATELLEAYWRNKPTASPLPSNGFKKHVTSHSKTSTNGKSNGHQIKNQVKRRASFNKKKSSSHTIFRQSNGTSNHVTNSSSKPITATNDNSLVKYRNEDFMKSVSIQRKDKKIEKEEVSSSQGSQLKIPNNYSLTTNNTTSENTKIARDVYAVDDRESVKDVKDEDTSSSESESSSDSDSTMEIDKEDENDDKAQDDQEEDEQNPNKDSKSKSSKVKLGPKKPTSNNRTHENIYDDKGVKSIIRNIDENWDPYVKEVVAIEPHDNLPNVLWIYISWRGGFTSVHLNTEVNKLCPQSIIQFYEKRIIFKGSLNYKNLTDNK
ncbi:hypothetical protein RclHR1_00220049 [Rhizophagus clarus]|uniref:Chromobox protein homolog 3-like n=1 Tax=Rhizophagus clarus TaxID=94130 RepID=A0A2Z6QVH5_9GLOM|nr:hypothetical protein RclHR1_00220049 [Rhizophagus clarus]GES84592.1 chromobox protein homolog 3-like [Rhizophagus clarus]